MEYYIFIKETRNYYTDEIISYEVSNKVYRDIGILLANEYTNKLEHKRNAWVISEIGAIENSKISDYFLVATHSYYEESDDVFDDLIVEYCFVKKVSIIDL
jgi:hypothetical protein